MINRVYDLFKSSFRESLIEEQTKDFIADYLSQLRFWFKSDYYKHEQEVRIILDKPKKQIEYIYLLKIVKKALFYPLKSV